MRTLFKTFIMVFMVTSIEAQNMNVNLLPYPAEIVLTNNKHRIDKSFSIQNSLVSERLLKYADKFIQRLSNRTGLFFDNPTIMEIFQNQKPSFLIRANRIGEVKLFEDESYKIIVNEKDILIESKTDIGALRGLETLLQLLSSDLEGYYFPTCEINDKPRFPWRGLMIDVARHFMPIEVIKRNLDGMAAVKMNVLHLHLSDDQGFRVESKIFPKLTELGSDGNYFTHEQIKEIIEYADDRGIRVYPEFDVPGHATAILIAFPELASAPGPYKIERKFGVMDPTLNPTIEETYTFLDKLFTEMSSLFKDEYFHIGGDENNGKQWNLNDSIQQFKKEKGIKDNHDLQAYFNNRVLKILTQNNKKMIGWDEILNDNVPNNIVIQSWRGKEALVEAAKKGYQGILSNGYYIDLMQPTVYHYLNDPIIENADLTELEKEKILGGEATMWAEWVTAENIDSRIWPRTAAIAERFWSPKEITDVEDMFKRLDKVSYQLEDVGLTHITFQEKFLRRLTNNQNTFPLKVLIDVVEPLQEYKRAGDAKKNGFEFSQYSPYTRVIDASIVDSKTILEFNKNVNNLVEKNDKSVISAIKSELKLLKENHSKLLPIIDSSPILFEIKPHSENLNKLAKVGLEAIDFFIGNEKVSGEWKQNAEIIIEESKKSYGQVEIVIVESIQKLVSALN